MKSLLGQHVDQVFRPALTLKHHTSASFIALLAVGALAAPVIAQDDTEEVVEEVRLRDCDGYRSTA